MEWTNAIQSAIDFMEQHITENISAEDVANHVHISSFYFQKGFRMLCGFSVIEYIRKRRLALAGGDLATTDMKIIDKESFTVLGVSKEFNYENCKQEIPLFWQSHYEKGNGKYVCGMFGINIDEKMGNDSFEYLIADLYDSKMEIPEGFVTRTIPAFTWAVFSCVGPMPTALQDVSTKIFSEWLPALKEYEFAAGYCVEMYDAADKYPNGTQDENYHTEIWIPIQKK